ncbi:PDCD5-related protein [Pyronema domesticum]|uniref:Similar to Programmed cell death protein 5 acc. no. P56812 n=1 Tax=Pyronema omphalodes (strain CBS 100304) TaxID=1076935 RepID=U4L3L4_PYROM|nr:PDCD5-related protein [Pyronema domesticum]CCX06903.1 Similar to Programmed cell death protein 5; acc. no. P56812 [Pyronema omphalodes CBS 100304]
MADNDELAKIRAARMAELQGGAQQGGQGGGNDQAAQEADSRKQIITQICTPEAADRLGRIAMVKADRARDLESRLIMLARSNQLRGRVTDDDLLKLMDMVDKGQKESGQGDIVFQRRRGVLDDDEDDW